MANGVTAGAQEAFFSYAAEAVGKTIAKVNFELPKKAISHSGFTPLLSRVQFSPNLYGAVALISVFSVGGGLIYSARSGKRSGEQAIKEIESVIRKQKDAIDSAERVVAEIQDVPIESGAEVRQKTLNSLAPVLQAVENVQSRLDGFEADQKRDLQNALNELRKRLDTVILQLSGNND
ncbi:MAG: hypothetical protein ChlgKO_02550 [Chlamydiales bacterium]